MNQRAETQKSSFWRMFGVYLLLGSASGVMLWLSLPGFELWYLSFVSLVPILVMLQGRHGKTAVLVTWLSGSGYYFATVSWLSHLTPPGWVALALYLSLGFLLFAILARVLLQGNPRLPYAVGIPVLWLAAQLLRSLPLGGFDWYLLGHNLYRRLVLIQIADLFGVFGVSFVVITVSAVIARIIHLGIWRGFSDRRDRGEAVLGAVYAVLLVLASFTYGTFRLAEADLKPGPTISVVQGNIPQDLKEFVQSDPNAHLDKARHMWETYVTLTRPLTKRTDDLVVWPETTTTFALEGDRTAKHDYSAFERKRILSIRRELDRPFMVGSIRMVPEDNALRYYNCAYYFHKDDGSFERYDKIYPVPFGEIVPFQGTWFAEVVEFFMPEGYQARLSAGTELKLFKLKAWTFAANVCYEDTKPSLNRAFCRMGAQFIVNLTNDGWFRETAELDQHLANSVFRSVENRVAQVRATNTGISAFINSKGAITSHIEDRQTGKHRRVKGVLTDTVMLDDRSTLYAMIGELFSWVMLSVAALWVLTRLIGRVVRLFRRG